MQLNLGNNIRQFRRRDKKTQEQLAEALGVTSQAVSRWESGGGYPDMNLITSNRQLFPRVNRRAFQLQYMGK